MSFKVGARTSSPACIPGLLLLGLLILPAVVTGTSDPEEGDGDTDLQCVCLKTTSRVNFKHVISVEVIRAGPHCPTSQMIATLKNGNKICLDPHIPINRKIIKKLTERN